MSKISRIVIKLHTDINIFTIVKTYLLRTISDKLYIYIDDRIEDISINNNIKHLLFIMNRFGIFIDKIIKYTDYYNIIRIYIHRYIKYSDILIKPNFNDINENIYLNDYKLFFEHYNNLTISLICDKNSKTNYIIYDKGYYDELFILTVIDDSENISYCPYDKTYISINNDIVQLLKTKYCFRYPEYVLCNIINSIDNYTKTNNININDIPIKYLYQINVENIIDIIKDYNLINNYIINITDNIDNVNNNNLYIIENPINIILSNNKTINLHNTSINLTKSLYIGNNNYEFTPDGNKYKLKYIGNVYIKLINNKIHGSFKNKTKNKNKKYANWVPSINPINKTCFIIEDSKTIIAIYYNNDIAKKKFLMFNNKLYIIHFNNDSNNYSYLIPFIKN